MLSLLPTFARAVWLDSFCRENVENRLYHHRVSAMGTPLVLSSRPVWKRGVGSSAA
jgi:hypothetical protein